MAKVLYTSDSSRPTMYCMYIARLKRISSHAIPGLKTWSIWREFELSGSYLKAGRAGTMDKNAL